MPPPEENADLPVFRPERVHFLLKEFYGDFLHHNYRLHLDWGITDNDVCQSRWRQLAGQSVSWYTTPYVAVGRRFMEILAAE